MSQEVGYLSKEPNVVETIVTECIIKYRSTCRLYSHRVTKETYADVGYNIQAKTSIGDY